MEAMVIPHDSLQMDGGHRDITADPCLARESIQQLGKSKLKVRHRADLPRLNVINDMGCHHSVDMLPIP